jgi:UDP-N-acetylmuramoyl-tripeptide--D-alanyl-D-alanine ligase
MSAVFSLSDLLAATHAKVFNRTAPGFDDPFKQASVSTDARSLQPGQIFLPLVGQRFDGHDFREQAYQAGAVAAFMQADRSPLVGLPNQLIVPDTLLAYQQLARFHRRRVNPKVVGITGSSGKTTTKAMFYAAFQSIYTTQCTQKNFNNDVGVAQTLLALEPHTQLAIVEMAMRGPGEITRLTVAGEPDIAVITNIGPAHIERLGSLDAIAQAKCEIVKGLHPNQGVVVANGDDALLMHTLKQVWAGRIETFSLDQATHIQATPAGGVAFASQGHTITLPVPGDHMVMNALAVMATARVLGAPLDQVANGLSLYQPEEGRYCLTAKPNRVHIIQDAYNANPASMEASLTAFLNQPTPLPDQQKSLILAGMNELGELSQHYHYVLGQWLAHHGKHLHMLVLIGEDCLPVKNAILALTPDMPLVWFPAVDQAKQWLAEHQFSNQLVLVKGSRSYQLETLFDICL